MKNIYPIEECESTRRERLADLYGMKVCSTVRALRRSLRFMIEKCYIDILRIFRNVHVRIPCYERDVQMKVVKVGFVKVGNIGSAPLLEFLLDERAERQDIDVRVVSSGAKLSLIHIPSPRDRQKSRMPSSA